MEWSDSVLLQHRSVMGAMIEMTQIKCQIVICSWQWLLWLRGWDHNGICKQYRFEELQSGSFSFSFSEAVTLTIKMYLQIAGFLPTENKRLILKKQSFFYE